MNKKYGIILVFVLLAGAVFLSACQSEVGRKVKANIANNNADINNKDGNKQLGDVFFLL